MQTSEGSPERHPFRSTADLAPRRLIAMPITVYRSTLLCS